MHFPSLCWHGLRMLIVALAGWSGVCAEISVVRTSALALGGCEGMPWHASSTPHTPIYLNWPHPAPTQQHPKLGR